VVLHESLSSDVHVGYRLAMLGEVHDGLESEIYVGHAGKKNWENRRENKTE
jgi:hypothetical protein